MNTLTAGQDLNDPKTKSEIAARILPLVNDVPNPVERDAYRQQVARVLQVDESALLLLSSQKKRSRRSSSNKAPVDQSRATALKGAGLGGQENIQSMEKYIIQYMAKDPDQVFRINRYLQSQKLERISVNDFQFSEFQQIFTMLEEAIKQNDLDPDQYLRDNLDEELSTALDGEFSINLPKLPEEHKIDEKRELEDIIRTLILMRQNAIDTQIKDLRFLQTNQDEPVEEKDLKAFQTNLMKLIRMRGILDKVLASPFQLD